MPPNLIGCSDMTEAFAAEVVAFAAAQNVDSIAKLISFFHLADLDRQAQVEFRLESSGRLTLRITAEGVTAEEVLESA